MTTRKQKLGFLSHSEVNAQRDAALYRVMVFLPLGQYPRGTLTTPNAVFHADEEIVFSVTHGKSWTAIDSDAPYSEFDWASPQELRLLSSLLLCERRSSALIRFYPAIRYSPVINSENLDLTALETVSDLKKLLVDTAKAPRNHHSDEFLAECLQGDYDLVPADRYNFQRIRTFWNYIDVNNYLLMRGICALIKAEMLACRREFWEEAIIVSYISLEASFQLISKELRASGVSNPSSKDASKWLHENFDKPFGHSEPLTEKYFEEFYEDRIRTMHPSSRFGEYPYAPIMHDDFCHLRRALREIFAFLVSREHGPDFHEEVSRYSSREINTT